AWYAADTGKLVRPEVIIRRKEPLIELRFSGCYKYPFFRCEKGGNKCIEIKKPRMCTAEYISQFIPQEKLQLLADDAMKYNYALIPIEADIYLQNVREYEETTGLRRNFRTSTIKERDFRKGRRLCIPKPFNGAVIEDYDLRASEFGIRCMITRIYAKIDKEHFPVELENRFASIGIAMHWIKNQQPPMWNDFLHNHLLKEIGIEPIPRWKYTEKAVIYNYNGIRISGHPDCVTVFCDPERDEKEWDLGIMDIKRGMYSAYERMGYFDQLLIYGMAVKQMLGLNPETIYLTLIKTPFDRRRFTNEEFAVREEAYRLHRYSKTKVNVASETVDKLHEDIVNSHARQQEILNSKKEAYKERNGSFEKGECVKCFDKPLCEIIFKELEGRSSMLDILPKPYPTKKHRSDLFASLNPPMKEIGLDLRLRMADRTRNDFQTKRRQKTQ
ncbi:MAG: hypothetical protein QW112_02695, partial [Candidatus Micrarchaeia archaeon]